MAALLYWQVKDPTRLQLSGLSQKASLIIEQDMLSMEEISLIESETVFPRSVKIHKPRLMCRIYVQKHADTAISDTLLKSMIRQRISRAIGQQMDLEALVTVTLFAPPGR